MSLEEITAEALRKLHDKHNRIGPDMKKQDFRDWANGRILMDARTTTAALERSGNSDYGMLVLQLGDIFPNFGGVASLSPVLAKVDGSFVISLTVAKH
jgi:hypothetical protein